MPTLLPPPSICSCSSLAWNALSPLASFLHLWQSGLDVNSFTKLPVAEMANHPPGIYPFSPFIVNSLLIVKEFPWALACNRYSATEYISQPPLQLSVCVCVVVLKYTATSSYPDHKKVRSHFVNKGPAIMTPGFPGGSAAKNPPAMQGSQETWVWSLGQEDPVGKEMATHSHNLAWEIPWTEEPDRLQSMGPKETWLSD